MQKIKPIHGIAKEDDIAPSQVSAWKKELEGRIVELFERKNAVNDSTKKQENLIAQLERKVGRQVIEKEFLEKKCVQLGIDLSERP